MGKKKKTTAKPAPKREFDVEQITDVPGNELEDLVFEIQSDPKYVGHQTFPEGDGEFTVVAIYRST